MKQPDEMKKAGTSEAEAISNETLDAVSGGLKMREDPFAQSQTLAKLLEDARQHNPES